MIKTDVALHGTNVIEINPQNEAALDVAEKILNVYAETLFNEQRELANKLSVSVKCAGLILFGRTRCWWDTKIERKLIKLDRQGKTRDMLRLVYGDCC